MLGAIIGDIAGSLYEFESPKTKDIELFAEGSRPTDDSMMTIPRASRARKPLLRLFILQERENQKQKSKTI